MRAVQDVAAGARSDAGEADNVDNVEVIRSYYAAVEKLGPLVRVRVSDMRFSTKFATRSRVVVDNFITRLPGSAEETWQPGTEEHALSGLFASLKIAGWTKEHCGFAMKRKDNEYELVGGNTRYLFLSEYFMKQAPPLSEAYTHGWVHVVPNEEDATVIAEGHNKVAACVRPPPTPQHDADIIYKRLTPLLDGERPRHDFVKEAVPGSQRNLAARLRKVVELAHDDDDGGMEGEHKSTVMHLLLRAISEHCACARANTRGGVSSKLKSVWFKSKNFGLMYARLYPKFLGDHEGGGELHVIPEAPRVGANESERERHWLSRYVACVSCAHVRISTKVDMGRLLRLCMEDCAKLTSVDDFDVHEAMERVVNAFSEVNVAETETSPPVTTDMQVGNVGAMPPFHEDLHMLAAAAIAPSACASTQTRNLAFKSGREVCPFCGSSSVVS
ncbi:hypothetical protein RI054_11g59520 [Pseudoscourfieldia marina]